MSNQRRRKDVQTCRIPAKKKTKCIPINVGDDCAATPDRCLCIQHGLTKKGERILSLAIGKDKPIYIAAIINDKSVDDNTRKICHAVSSVTTDDWCNNNCNNVPPKCPTSDCSCGSPDDYIDAGYYELTEGGEVNISCPSTDNTKIRFLGTELSGQGNLAS